MPSPEHAADLERVLARAAEECESGMAWFGEGLPRDLQRAIEATSTTAGPGVPDVAFVEVGRELSEVPTTVRRVVALSARGLQDLETLLQLALGAKPSIARLICPVAVFDLTTDRVRVREIRRGLTAADLQREAGTTLWSGPDLKEM